MIRRGGRNQTLYAFLETLVGMVDQYVAAPNGSENVAIRLQRGRSERRDAPSASLPTLPPDSARHWD